MKGFDPDAPAEAPVVLWTTARDATITALHCPALEQAGVNPVALLGQSLDRWLDGDPRHPLLQACRRALDGAETPVRMHWGALTFTGRVTPLRDHAGRITGTIGELEVHRRRTSDGFGEDAMEAADAGSSRGAGPGVIASLLSRALAVLATQAGWQGALLWRVESTGRLRRIASAGDAARHESIAEPYAWLTAICRQSCWTDPGLWLLPLTRPGQTRPAAVLALCHEERARPADADVQRIHAAASPLLGLWPDPDDPTREDDEEAMEMPWPRPVPVSVAAPALAATADAPATPEGVVGPDVQQALPRRSWSTAALLAVFLVPLPLLLSACRLAS